MLCLVWAPGLEVCLLLVASLSSYFAGMSGLVSRVSGFVLWVVEFESAVGCCCSRSLVVLLCLG